MAYNCRLAILPRQFPVVVADVACDADDDVGDESVVYPIRRCWTARERPHTSYGLDVLHTQSFKGDPFLSLKNISIEFAIGPNLFGWCQVSCSSRLNGLY